MNSSGSRRMTLAALCRNTSGVGRGTAAPSCCAKAPGRGCCRFTDGILAMSGHPAVQQALRNHHFESLLLSSLYVSV